MRVLISSRHVVAAGAALCLFGGRADAKPLYASDLEDSKLALAKVELAQFAAREGVSAKLAHELLELDVFAFSSDRNCPGIDVDVINASRHVMWAVEVKIEQRRRQLTGDDEKRIDTLHLPYLPPKSQTRVRATCATSDYSSRYGSADITIDYVAKATRSLAVALPRLVEQKVDYDASPTWVQPKPGISQRSLLEAALAMDDRSIARELLTAIGKTGIGAAELRAMLSNGNASGILAEATAELDRLPAAQQADIARMLIGTPAAAASLAKLLPLVDRVLCAGPRAGVVGLWAQAQSEAGIPVAELRDRVRAKCTLRPTDATELVAAFDRAPAYAAAADALAAPLFGALAKAWRAQATPSAGYLAFARVTASVPRFDLTIRAPSPALIASVAMAEGAEVAHKAAWLAAAAPKLSASELDETIAALYKLLGDDKVRTVEMQDAIGQLRALAPDAVNRALTTSFADSKVFDPKKLEAAGVELTEFLGFDQKMLGNCTRTFEDLRICAAAIAAYRPRNGATLDQARGALLADFIVGAKNLIRGDVGNYEALVALAGELRAAGITTEWVSDRLCDDARSQRADPEQMMGLVAKIDPNATCLIAAHAEVSSRARNDVIFLIVALLGIVLPLPLTGWSMKRKWRRLERVLPLPEVDRTATVARVHERLAVLARRLPNGIAEARRELAGGPAAAAIERLDPALLERAVDISIEALRHALTSGDASTALVDAGGLAIYAVALPVRAPRPQTIQRYLGAPWPEHIAAIQRAAGAPLLALVVSSDPSASEASLLVGYHDGATASDPDILLDAREARERNANPFRHVIPLAATSAPT